ncbi:MAG: hypothetical protein U1F11_02220 [Steroidobacteraceae bacterium]
MRIGILAGAAGLALLACAQTACSGPSTRTSAPGAADASPGAAASLQIVIDPQTGQPREPTAQELAKLQQATVAAKSGAARASSAPQEIHYPDGTVGIRFPEESLQPLQACVGPDGQVNEDCGRAAAAAAQPTPAPAPAPAPTPAPAPAGRR